LAQELNQQPEFYETYLIELLSLFADKGVAIQNLKTSNHHVKVDIYSASLTETDFSGRPMI
jgi:phosphatidylinositol 4-kinase